MTGGEWYHVDFSSLVTELLHGTIVFILASIVRFFKRFIKRLEGIEADNQQIKAALEALGIVINSNRKK